MRELDLLEFARRKKKDPSTVRSWIKKGALKFRRDGLKGIYKIPVSELNADIYKRKREMGLPDRRRKEFKNKKH